MKVISPIVKTFGLSAVFAIAWTQHLGVLADENPAAGGFGRSGAEDRLAVSHDLRLHGTAELCC